MKINVRFTGDRNHSASYYSPDFTVTVNAPNVAPAFTTQPLGQTVTTGGGVTFTAAASGSPTPTFQWLKNGVPIGGATGRSYTITSASLSDVGRYTVVATNSVGSATSNVAILRMITTNPAWSIIGSGDFNGDGHTDLVWENSADGTRGLWEMDHVLPFNWVDLLYFSPPWHMMGTGDFNGDGETDILWENVSSGDRGMWIMNRTVPAAWINLPAIPVVWRIVGTGDFNGDGMTDLL